MVMEAVSPTTPLPSAMRDPREPVAEVPWKINRRMWRRRLPRPLPCAAGGTGLCPRLCPQCFVTC